MHFSQFPRVFLSQTSHPRFHRPNEINWEACRLGGVVVSVLVIRPKIRGFKPGQGDGFSTTIKIRSTPSFTVKVKPETPCRKILHHVKITCNYEQKYFARPNSSLLPPFYQMTLLLEIARKLWWTNQEFPFLDFISPWFSMLIYLLGDQQ
jgi:hypothetical protein